MIDFFHEFSDEEFAIIRACLQMPGALTADLKKRAAEILADIEKNGRSWGTPKDYDWRKQLKVPPGSIRPR